MGTGEKTEAGAAPGGEQGIIRIGVGGWTYPEWRGPFYPEGLPHKRELEYAATRLTSIEINATFYRTQKPESFARWRDETPDGFVFALKGPRFVTTRPSLVEAGASIDRFFSSGVGELGAKLGPINWQFPPNRSFDPEDFDGFLKLLPKTVDGRPIRHAIEVRNGSFRRPEFVAMARHHGVAIVVSGDSRYPLIADVTARFVYVRIMGTQEAEPLGYGPPALASWAERARTWAAGGSPAGLDLVAGQPAPATAGRDVFLYVISGHKRRNPAAAVALIERIGG